MSITASFNPMSAAEPAWFKSGVNDSIYVEAYELALIPAAVPRKIFRFPDIVVLIKTAAIDYHEIAGVKTKFGPDRLVSVTADHRISTSEMSPKLVTVQPHQSSNTNGDAHLAERSMEYVSLLISTNYRNIACRRLFSHLVSRADGSMMSSGDLIRLPFDLPPPDLSHEALNRFPRSHQSLERLEQSKKQKVTLSLHWHIKGVQSEGLDSFLSLWIALETLTMTSSNISGMNEALGSAYSATPLQAAQEFGAGRLFGLRSRIVHNGIRKRISSDLTDYMECLYADLLVHELLGEKLGRARALLISKQLDIKQLTA